MEVVLDGWNIAPFIPPFIIVAAVVMALILGSVAAWRADKDALSGALAVVAVMLGVFGTLAVAIAATESANAYDRWTRTTVLEQHYADFELFGDTFTAERADGTFVRGQFRYVEDERWMLEEVTAP